MVILQRVLSESVVVAETSYQMLEVVASGEVLTPYNNVNSALLHKLSGHDGENMLK